VQHRGVCFPRAVLVAVSRDDHDDLVCPTFRLRLFLHIFDLADAQRHRIIERGAAADEVIFTGQGFKILKVDTVMQDLEEVIEQDGGHAGFSIDFFLVADGRVESSNGVAFQAAHGAATVEDENQFCFVHIDLLVDLRSMIFPHARVVVAWQATFQTPSRL